MSKRKVETSQLEISSVLKRLIAEILSLSKLQGHAKVESLLITIFEKHYYDKLLKIDGSDPQTMVEAVKKLALDFINNLPNATLDEIDKIYQESVTTEVGNIQTTDKGLITKKKSAKDAYITHPAVTPVKKLCVSQLDEGSPKKEKFESNVKKAIGAVRNKSSHAYKILEEELEYIRSTLERAEMLIGIVTSFQDVLRKKQQLDETLKTIVNGCQKDKKPFFVVNCPMYIPVSLNLEESSDDEIDGEFTEGNFINPPFVVKRGNESKRGRLLKANIPPQSLSANSSHSHYVQRFISKLRFEGWEEEFAHNMFVVIGLNRPRSLSSARNKALYAEYNSKLDTDVRHEVQAFFWDRVWHQSFDQKEVKYSEVQRFYKQLKRYDKKKAEEFRRVNEGPGYGNVPYQDIRDRLRMSEESARIVEAIRKLAPDLPVYLSMLDSDTCHFNGIYSAYERSCRTKGYPTVMSTGYEFSSNAEDYKNHSGAPLEFLEQLRLASVIDRAIRINTAQYLGGSVYYPEPNTCVLIPQNEFRLPYTFIDMETKGDEESAVMLRRVVEHIKDVGFRFIDDRPLLTTLPIRSFGRSRHNNKKFQFSQQFIKGGKPTEDDIKNLADITQSHFYFDLWARNIEKNNPNVVSNCSVKHGHLCALFNYFRSRILLDNNDNTERARLRKALHDMYDKDDKGLVDALWDAAKKSMERVKELFESREQYFATKPGYQVFIKGAFRDPKLDRSQIASKEILAKSLHSSEESKNLAIGPKKIDGYQLDDVPGDGNCFYYAIVKQLSQRNYNVFAECPKSTECHTWLRSKVEGQAFSDRRWASEEDIFTMSRVLNMVIDVIDTRRPEEGYHRYYQEAGIDIPADVHVLKLAFTGNHFLSVKVDSTDVNEDEQDIAGSIVSSFDALKFKDIEVNANLLGIEVVHDMLVPRKGYKYLVIDSDTKNSQLNSFIRRDIEVIFESMQEDTASCGDNALLCSLKAKSAGYKSYILVKDGHAVCIVEYHDIRVATVYTNIADQAIELDTLLVQWDNYKEIFTGDQDATKTNVGTELQDFSSMLNTISKISDGFGILNYYLAGWGNVVVDYLDSFISSLQDIIPSTIQEEHLLLRALESVIDFRDSYHNLPFSSVGPSGPDGDPDDGYYGRYLNNSTPDHRDYHGYIVGYNVTDLEL